MKKLISLAILAASFTVSAQVNQFGQPTYLTVATNPGNLATAVSTITVPAISLTISSITNINTIVTNTLFKGMTVGAATIPATQFIYRASDYGTTNDFTTNWGSYTIYVTNYLLGQAIPQTGSNTVYIK
jgi:hypothetical protein